MKDRAAGSYGKFATKIGNQVYSGEDKAFVKGNKTGQITNLRRECKMWMLDLW